MSISYQVETITAHQFVDILARSGLGARRPVEDLPRLQRMLDGADLVITARESATGKIVGVARSLTDWSYACYLADLAVDVSYQRKGIGAKMIELTREHAGDESFCLLISAPEAVDFYRAIGMPPADRAFMYPRLK
ncbi:GNAT family N-acetyltransferase [Altererythrobacter sp. Root672]|uniref:GNAT family N-acetyltransferase n=1 Tax=Altererythrobacter sp. Root672 TaxID=1736584 RepID=UPI0006FCFE38|nr:GNAT family N-acetyltransferase [Altererythrobacter sp. Root672]KRA81636.1 GCN5 family acetyltransferase [Altererythrobacter sp. Root672]